MRDSLARVALAWGEIEMRERERERERESTLGADASPLHEVIALDFFERERQSEIKKQNDKKESFFLFFFAKMGEQGPRSRPGPLGAAAR